MNELLANTFNNEAGIYDETTQYLLLNYDDILNRAIQKIDYSKNSNFSILDLGCGTGNLIKKIRENYPKAKIYALDFSNAMIDVSKEKNIPNIKYICADMFDLEHEHLPYFDIIITSFVFHNFKSIEEHDRIIKKIYNHLSINGKVIIADLVNLVEPRKKRKYQECLVNTMRDYGLHDDEIVKWIGILEIEDAPLTTSKTSSLLSENGFEEISISFFNECGSAIFCATKKIEPIQLKTELLFYGLKENDLVKNIYLAQNPQGVWKTGNNGIFLSFENLNALISINHAHNHSSPYELIKHKDSLMLKKNNSIVCNKVTYMKIPEWCESKITELDNQEFSNYFVLEGERFLHLAYKGCSFSLNEKCKFCSTKRRSGTDDNSAEDVSKAILSIIDKLPSNIQICLGGGTYIPFDKNIEYFSTIIKAIRSRNKNIPIWVECIPTSNVDIGRLINDGATSFGFNIEIWDDNTRKKLCPGKSKISKQVYIDSFQYVIKKLGKNRVGTCIIVGLDSYKNIKDAIDYLVSIGVEPCILPYKKYNRTNLTDYSIPQGYQKDFYALSKYAAIESKKHGVIFKQNQGCLNCTYCTIMHDFQNQID